LSRTFIGLPHFQGKEVKVLSAVRGEADYPAFGLPCQENISDQETLPASVVGQFYLDPIDTVPAET
jgi:hypothetical protein